MVSFVSVTSRVVMGSMGWGGQNLSLEEWYSLLLKTVNYSAHPIFCLCLCYQKITS